MNHFFGRLQIVCYENSSLTELTAQQSCFAPTAWGGYNFPNVLRKISTCNNSARYINTQKYKFSHCCIFRVFRNYIGGTHHESAIRIHKDFQFLQSLGGPLAISILAIFTQPSLPRPFSSVQCMYADWNLNVKCHETSNVMKYKMSWNVKCPQASNVICSGPPPGGGPARL